MDIRIQSAIFMKIQIVTLILSHKRVENYGKVEMVRKKRNRKKS